MRKSLPHLSAHTYTHIRSNLKHQTTATEQSYGTFHITKLTNLIGESCSQSVNAYSCQISLPIKTTT